MVDVFNEVDEQLRSARLQTMFRRGWPFAAGLLLVVLLAAAGVWAWRAHVAQAEGADSQRYQDAMQALSMGDAVNAETKFAALAKSGLPSYRSLALTQEAGIRLKANDPKGAAAFLDQAATAAKDPILADGARLKAAFLLMDSAPYDDIRARLEPLTRETRPFHAVAREGLAVEELANGRTAEAKGDFQLVALSPDVSDGARVRANAALAMISSGQVPDLNAIARTAAGLKAAPPPSAGGLTPEQIAAIRAQLAARGQGGGGAPQPAGAPTPGQAPASGAPQ